MWARSVIRHDSATSSAKSRFAALWYKNSDAVEGLQMREDVQYPGVIGVAFRWRRIIRPAGIVLQVFIIPAFQIERRIGHDVVEIQPPVKVVGKGRIAHLPEVAADVAQNEAHLGQSVGGRFFLLAVSIDTADVATFFPDEFCALDEHAA